MRKRTEIRAELDAELSLEAPDLDKVADLSAELKRARGALRRLKRQRDVQDMQAELTVAPMVGLTEKDAEAIKTWPPELRARLGRSSMNRVIDRSTLEDPGEWDTRADPRRRSPWS